MLEKFKELKFTSWCIENRTAVYVFTLLVSLAGYEAYRRLPKEQFPDIVVPTISVATIYPGATPEDIENMVTKPIEKQLKSINGIKKVTSNSISDFSLIVAEFSTDLDPALCKQKVSDAVDKVKKDLPSDLDRDPQIQEFDFSELPIMNINLSGDLPLDKIKEKAEDLQDRIEGLKEITRVDIVGGLEREIQVDVDLYKMTSAGLTLMDIENAIARENLNVSGGELRVGELRRNLRVTGEFKNPGDIGQIVVRSFMGNLVALKDIAQIKDGFKEKQDFARLDGKTVVTMNVIKRSGENLINAADKIAEIIQEEKLGNFPKGLNVVITGDTSVNTRIQLQDLINTVIIGFLLVVLILMFFMGLTNAFFVALSVPLTSLLAFMIIPGFDMTMNVVVLFAFLLALGIVVDDAIVVIENTHRIFHQYDLDIVRSAKYAAGEVFVPVLSGTFTTLAPFIPLLFWPGLVGKFMSNIPMTLIIALGASLFVAYVMNPVFAVSFMKKDHHDADKRNIRQIAMPIALTAIVSLLGYVFKAYGMANFALFMIFMIILFHFGISRAINHFQLTLFPNVITWYRKSLLRLVHGKNPVLVILLALVLLVFSFIALIIRKPAIDFFPNADPNFTYVYIQFPFGTDAVVTDSLTQQVEERIYRVIGKNNPVVTSVITNVGLGAGDPRNPDRVPTPHKSKISVAYVKYADRNGVSTIDLMNKIREELKSGVPGANISVEKEPSGPPTGKPVNIEISGDDFAVLQQLTNQVKQRISRSKIQGIDELKSDLQISKPEITLVIDKEKAQREGVTLAQIAVELRSALFGKEVSKYRDVDDAPIMLRLDAKYRQRAEDLMNLNISYMDMSQQAFRQIPVSSLARIEYANTISTINRKNQKRVVTLASDVVDGYNANEINAQIQDLVQEMNIPDGYEISLTGEQEQQKETADFLGLAFMGAIALMFLTLTIQFNSVAKPIIITSTVLFSFIGVFLGFAVFKMKFSIVMTGVGIFALSGIVIRNGILLVEFIDELRMRGKPVEEAVVEGGATRLTPVLLTALAAILGLIPLAIGLNIDFVSLFSSFEPHFHLGGDQVAFWGPLAWTMIFGLSVATFLTLLVLPSMYMLGYRTKQWITQLSIFKS